MRRLLLTLHFIFLLFFFFACSNNLSENDGYDENSTLRYLANELDSATLWTEELEAERLTVSVSSVEGISARLNLSPLIVLASLPSDSSKIFPTLGSFGSLDTSLISKPLRSMLTSFSESIARNEDADSFFEKECLYSLAIFYSDFERIFSSCFDFNDSSKKPFFSKFVFGEPFLDGVYYEVPIKFFAPEATLTLCVFCFEKAGNWQIDQVQIADWEIFNGKK